MATPKQTIAVGAGGALVVAFATALGLNYYEPSSKPSYILQAQLTLPVANDGGVLVGTIVGVLSTPLTTDVGVASAPDAGGASPDARADAAVAADAAVVQDAAPPPADAGPAPAGGGVREGPWPVTQNMSPPGATYTIAPLTRPTVGGRVSDPVFHTALRRLPDGMSHFYSQLQAFSSDDALMLTGSSAGYSVIRVLDGATVAGPDGGWNAARWLPGGHELMYLSPSPVRAMAYNVDQHAVRTLATTTYDYISTDQSYEEVSDDGRYTAGLFRKASGAQAALVLDLVTGGTVAAVDLNALFTSGTCAPLASPTWTPVDVIDRVAVSPLGGYLEIQWKTDGGARCNGLEVWDARSGTFKWQMYGHHAHADRGVEIDGREFVASCELAHPMSNGWPAITKYYYGAGAGGGLVTVGVPIPWYSFEHMSCRGPRGGCLISADPAPIGGSPAAMIGEVWWIRWDGSRTRLAHHRSQLGSSCSDPNEAYWRQPKASASRDGRLVVFATDWSLTGCPARSDMLIELPAGSLP